jgi:hypothetical protein
MKELIFEIENSLSKEECDKIIRFFEEKKERQYEGIVGSHFKTRVDKTVKLTMDMALHSCNDFQETVNLLLYKVHEGLNKYIENIDPEFNIYFFDRIFTNVTYNSLLIHKYFKNQGHFYYHNDFSIDHVEENRDKYKFRILNYLFYLNDVDEGGETEFFSNTTVKPTCGKLLFFPSEWFYPHKGCIPISNDKYVIAGWIYVNL